MNGCLLGGKHEVCDIFTPMAIPCCFNREKASLLFPYGFIIAPALFSNNMLRECETSEKATSTNICLVDSVRQRCEGKAEGKEGRINTKLVHRGTEGSVCSPRPARSPAVPRRASGFWHLHDPPGKITVYTKGLCMTQALSLWLLHLQKLKHLHIVMDWKPLARVWSSFILPGQPFQPEKETSLEY